LLTEYSGKISPKIVKNCQKLSGWVKAVEGHDKAVDMATKDLAVEGVQRTEKINHQVYEFSQGLQ